MTGVQTCALPISHLADEVEQGLALRPHQAGQQLWYPCQPLDGRHPDAVLVHGVGQRVLVVEAQEPQDLGGVKERGLLAGYSSITATHPHTHTLAPTWEVSEGPLMET